ncbi:MAG: type IV pilus modification PilV family protein [Nitrospiraceae bacterium]
MSQHIGWVRPGFDEKGFSLVEVMFSMIILAFGVLGVMGMFQWADHGLRHGANGTRALAMVESRLEVKRTVPWDALLLDDLDSDGLPEITMRDDGTQGDVEVGDGVYTASREQDGIRLVWTVQPDRAGSLRSAGSVVIQARASYPVGPGQRREIKIGTFRANPQYLGIR